MKLHLAICTATTALLAPAWAQSTGPSSSQSAYVLPAGPHAATTSTMSLLTVGDLVGGYKMVGIPDGLGAFDNGDGTFTLLMNQELTNSAGVVRAHGSKGAFVSKWVINKNTLAMVSGADLIQSVYPWDFGTNASSASPSTTAFSRFCSADLPAATAFYNASTGLGTQARIFMNGEEDSAAGHGRCYAHVVTGTDAGKSYELGRFVLSNAAADENASENCLANPFAQDKTLVMIDNDGGGSNVNNKVALYVGTKTNTGTEVDKAGLTNGTVKFIAVAGSSAEIVNTTTRATNIVSGTAFTLSSTGAGGTTFSRPEDGAWNPLNPKQYYFVTTDRIDQVTDGVGSQIGRSRLWRLTFADLSNPDAGGVIDLLLDGTEGQVMFDNLTVAADGHVILQEDVGGAAHNGKMWDYDPTADTLTLIAKHDPARFGDITAGGTIIAATAPFNNDEESSGVIDITALMAGSPLSTGRPQERWFLSSDQAHYTSGPGVDSETVEGGQLFALHFAGKAATVPPTVKDVVNCDVKGGKLQTSKASFRVKGVASSNAGIAKVQYRLPGEKKFRTAKGTESWSFNASLKPGKNKILVHVISVSGETTDKVVIVTRRK
jgi:hypothetical protein